MLNFVISRHIGTMTACAGLAYLGMAVGQWSSSMGEPAVALVTVYGLTGIALLAFSWRTKNQPLPVDWSTHVAGVVFLVVTATFTLGYALSHNPSNSKTKARAAASVEPGSVSRSRSSSSS